MLKKLLISILIGVTLLLNAAPLFQAKAQASWYNQSPFEWYAKVYDDTNPNEIFGERYTAAQVQWITYSVFFLPVNLVFSLLGVPPTPITCVMSGLSGAVDVQTCLTSSIPDFVNSITTKISGLTSENLQNNLAKTPQPKADKHYVVKQIFTQDRQLSGISYVRNVVNKLNPTATVKAADTSYGYNRLGIILPFWKATRNIAFSFFVIATIITAFMIMFKVKISPQAVVTIQSAIPKIIVSILLVTFSYAIAGFVIDLIYVAMGIFAQFFPAALFRGETLSADAVKATFDFLQGWTFDGFLTLFIYTIIYLVVSIVFSILITAFVLFKGALMFGTASVIMGALLIVFFLINIIILIVYIFIGLFNFFKALAMFYVEVILGPIKLAMGALPMSHGAFGNWIKALLSRALVFPVTGVLWYFGFIFLFAGLNSVFVCNVSGRVSDATLISTIESSNQALNTMLTSVGGENNFMAQFVGSGETWGQYACWGPPLLRDAGVATPIAFLLISISCMLLIAKVPKMIETMFQGKPFDFEGAISEPVKTGAYAAGSYIEEKGKLPFIPMKIPKGLGELLKTVSRTRM